jgi:hypothetical protein
MPNLFYAYDSTKQASPGPHPWQSQHKAATLLGVGEVLELKDLNFPYLFDERDDGESIVVARGTVEESERLW